MISKITKHKEKALRDFLNHYENSPFVIDRGEYFVFYDDGGNNTFEFSLFEQLFETLAGYDYYTYSFSSKTTKKVSYTCKLKIEDRVFEIDFVNYDSFFEICFYELTNQGAKATSPFDLSEVHQDLFINIVNVSRQYLFKTPRFRVRFISGLIPFKYEPLEWEILL